MAFNYDEDVLKPSLELNNLLKENSTLGYPVIEGRIHSSDVFYRDSGKTWENIRDEHDVLCVEMESFAHLLMRIN